jgi:phenylpropionate dioxygenase-like ring-hydroxylating dioxygenase large terminal subunit
VSHHGIVGNRYRDAKYYDMLRLRELSTQDGCAFEVTPATPPATQTIHDFQPPCLMKISSSFTDGGQLILVLYATPTRPGWCRHIGCQVLVKNQAGKQPKGLAFFGLPMPNWLGHLLASLFLHQDLVFLHYQEKMLARQGQPRWLDAVYTPNPQDTMIIVFRRWLEQRAGGGIPWRTNGAELPLAERDKQKLFDVWSTHTQHCAVCQKALKRINRLQVLAYGLAIVCLGLGILIDARALAVEAAISPAPSIWSAPSIGFWGMMGGMVLFASAGYLLKKLSRLFYVYQFEHAQND